MMGMKGIMPRKKSNRPKIAKVLLVDDHPIVRQGFMQFIRREPDLEVCGEAEDATQALDAIDRLSPDIAIIDLSLKGINSLDLIRKIKMQYPKLLMLVVSVHDESRYAERVLRAGARGYVMKQEKIEIVLTALRQVLRGEIYLSERMIPQVLTRLIDEPHDSVEAVAEVLSDREIEIFQLIGQGWKTCQIAEKLDVSVKTIESHQLNIKKKLNFKNAIELYQRAFQWVVSENGE